jgi:hypothetical protein
VVKRSAKTVKRDVPARRPREAPPSVAAAAAALLLAAHLAAEAAANNLGPAFYILRHERLELPDPFMILVSAVVAAANYQSVEIGGGCGGSGEFALGAAEDDKLVTRALQRAAPELRGCGRGGGGGACRQQSVLEAGARNQWYLTSIGHLHVEFSALDGIKGPGCCAAAASASALMRGWTVCGLAHAASRSCPTSSVISFHFSASSHSRTAMRRGFMAIGPKAAI